MVCLEALTADYKTHLIEPAEHALVRDGALIHGYADVLHMGSVKKSLGKGRGLYPAKDVSSPAKLDYTKSIHTDHHNASKHAILKT